MSDESGSVSSDEQTRRELARASAEQATLRDLVRLIAHDLNNPLQSITLILELLELEVEGEETGERVRQCVEGAALMRHLVRDLAQVARPIPDDEIPTVGATIDQTLGVLRRRLERHGIDVERDDAAFAERRLPSGAHTSILRWTLLSALLGTIDAATRAESERHRLTVSARKDQLRLELVAASSGAAETSNRPSPEHWQRVTDACAGSSLGVSVDERGLTIALPA